MFEQQQKKNKKKQEEVEKLKMKKLYTNFFNNSSTNNKLYNEFKNNNTDSTDIEMKNNKDRLSKKTLTEIIKLYNNDCEVNNKTDVLNKDDEDNNNVIHIKSYNINNNNHNLYVILALEEVLNKRLSEHSQKKKK